MTTTTPETPAPDEPMDWARRCSLRELDQAILDCEVRANLFDQVHDQLLRIRRKRTHPELGDYIDTRRAAWGERRAEVSAALRKATTSAGGSVRLLDVFAHGTSEYQTAIRAVRTSGLFEVEHRPGRYGDEVWVRLARTNQSQ